MAIAKRMAKRGFTLIELMIVVVIIGVLAALAIYGVSQYVTNAKTAEARASIGRMGKDALNAFEGEQMGGTVMALGDTRGISRRLCGANPSLVPAVPQTEGVKYQPTATDFNTGSSDAGFRCLGFSMDQPIIFQYGFNSNSDGDPAEDTHVGLAFGQATMSGVNRIIAQSMAVQGTAATGGFMLTLAPALSEVTGAALTAGTNTSLPTP